MSEYLLVAVIYACLFLVIWIGAGPSRYSALLAFILLAVATSGIL